ncbi:hypothetical protein SAMN05216196_102420 [Lutimaribacter pacificus]|uniref:Glyceraldehyde-3-phosphate dehydrogenase n=1 Tax=Lutimaribacter pacificus TaxID=391948 RepID=A0A1H0F026_9RHOB|nr:hypothetical protein [Lutimaribacter pacificus]SDN87992.1 hypothetical protein SAMN05216196_102420 [Lutimaribacter pacificus]SHK43086.1 hypothetical protein SAMN05444142_105134 [Lutimaribacter pacificus]
MTNQIAIGLGLSILAAIGIDAFACDGANLLFLAKKGLELIEWLAFWR